MTLQEPSRRDNLVRELLAKINENDWERREDLFPTSVLVPRQHNDIMRDADIYPKITYSRIVVSPDRGIDLSPEEKAQVGKWFEVFGEANRNKLYTEALQALQDYLNFLNTK